MRQLEFVQRLLYNNTNLKAKIVFDEWVKVGIIQTA